MAQTINNFNHTKLLIFEKLKKNSNELVQTILQIDSLINKIMVQDLFVDNCESCGSFDFIHRSYFNQLLCVRCI